MARREIGSQSQGGGDDRIIDLKKHDQIKIRILEPYVEEWRQYTLKAKNDDDSDITRFVVSRPGDPLARKGFKSAARYAVNVWDYTSDSVKILVGGKQIFGQFDAWKKSGLDVMASDIVIQRTGEKRDTTYTPIRLDTSPFEHADAATDLHDLSLFDKAPTEPELFKILDELEIDYDAIRLPSFTVEKARDWDIPFGKHKGEKAGDVLDTDPEYFVWFTEQAESKGEVGRDAYVCFKTLLTDGDFDPNAGMPTRASQGGGEVKSPTPKAAESEPEDEPEKDNPEAEPAPEHPSPVEVDQPTVSEVKVDEEVVKGPASFKKWLKKNGHPGIATLEKDDDGDWTLELEDETYYQGKQRGEVLTKAFVALSKKAPKAETPAAPTEPSETPTEATDAAPATSSNGDAAGMTDEQLLTAIREAIKKPEFQDFRKVMGILEEVSNGTKFELSTLDHDQLVAMHDKVSA